MNKILIILLVITTLTSCSEYQKALKSEDPAKKAEVAKKLFDQEKYSKAIRLYEQAAPSYKAKPQGEQVFYYFSKAYYETEQYYLAGYQLESYAANYPKSEKREEANFLSAECYYKLSPRYSLDQIDTQKALSKLQKFIDTYPNSEYLPKANVYVKELREKEEKKVYEVAKQYNSISDFKSLSSVKDIFSIFFSLYAAIIGSAITIPTVTAAIAIVIGSTNSLIACEFLKSLLNCSKVFIIVGVF